MAQNQLIVNVGMNAKQFTSELKKMKNDLKGLDNSF